MKIARFDCRLRRRLFCVVVVAVCVTLSGSAGLAGESRSPSTPSTADTHRTIVTGNGLLHRGLYELAAKEYRAFLADHSDQAQSSDARYGLGICQFRLSQYGEALATLAKIDGAGGFPFAADVDTMIGQCHLALGQFTEASDAFQNVLRRFAEHPLADEAAAGNVEALYRAGKHEEAIEQCSDLLSDHPQSPLRWRALLFGGLAKMAGGNHAEAAGDFGLIVESAGDQELVAQSKILAAQCHHQAGAMEMARRLYRSIIEAGGIGQTDALYGLALISLREGQPDRTRKYAERLIHDDGGSPLVGSARFLIGRGWFDEGEYGRASEIFESLVDEGFGRQDEAVYWLSKCLLRTNEPESAKQWLSRLATEYPTSSVLGEANYDLGLSQYRLGEYEACIREMTSFRERYADHSNAADALQLMALAEHQQKNYRKSVEHCESFIRNYPAHAAVADVTFLLAENLFLGDRLEEAVSAYAQYLSFKPGDNESAKARYRLGLAHYRLGQFVEAESNLAPFANATDSVEFRGAYYVLGDIAFQLKKWKQAERLLTIYMEGQATLGQADDALFKLALSAQRLSQYSQALAHLDRLLAEFPDSVHRDHAAFERGQALLSLGETQTAKSAFTGAAELKDASIRLHAANHLGTLALQNGEFEVAARHFREVADDCTDEKVRSHARYHEGVARLGEGKFEQAAAVFRELVKAGESLDASLSPRAQLATALSRLNQCEEALGIIAQLERGDSSSMPASVRQSVLYEKAWCLKQMGRHDDAADAYRSLAGNADRSDLRAHGALELASLLMERGDYSAAAPPLRELHERVANGALTIPMALAAPLSYRLGVCEFELGRYSESAAALSGFAERFASSPLIASASYFCGEALYRLGRIDDAAQHFRVVVDDYSSDEGCAAALLRLGDCATSKQEWMRAERLFSEYLERFGERAQWYQAQFGMGWARENSGRYEEAVAAYGALIERHQGPTAARAQFQIGECLFAQKRHVEALSEFLKVDILYGYPEWSSAALYEAGRCFELLSNPSKAGEQFRQVVEKYGDSEWAKLAAQHLTTLSSATSLPGR